MNAAKQLAPVAAESLSWTEICARYPDPLSVGSRSGGASAGLFAEAETSGDHDSGYGRLDGMDGHFETAE